MTNFNIQIISDTVCPWCYIGFKRLSRAIITHRANNPHDTFTLHWRAFYLNANSPKYPGTNKMEMYKNKFGAERVRAMLSRLEPIGQAEGIAFSFGGMTGKTRDSHRVIWFAGEREREREKQQSQQQSQQSQQNAGSDEIGGIQTRVVERLFQAYFENEGNITDTAVLVDAAVKAGLDEGEVKGLFDEENGKEKDIGGDEVDKEAEVAARQLVSGVPFFEIQGKYVVEGADEPETFLEIFQRVKTEE